MYKPIFIQGLPGIGLVGKIAIDYIIEQLKPTKFAELYSPYLTLPDGDVGIKINLDGTFLIPKYEFFAYTSRDPHLILLTGDIQPRVWGQYQIAESILDFISKYESNTIIALGGYGSQSRDPNIIYAIGSDTSIIEGLKKKDALVAQSGVVKGAFGVILGLGKERLLKCLGLLGATMGNYPDLHASKNLIRLITKMYDLPINFDDLDRQISDMDSKMKLLRDLRYVPPPIEEKTERKPTGYIS